MTGHRKDSWSTPSTLAMHRGLVEALLGSEAPCPARAEDCRSRSQELKMKPSLPLPLVENTESWVESQESWVSWRVQKLKPSRAGGWTQSLASRGRGAGEGETADGGSPEHSGYQDADAPRHGAHEVSITCSLHRPRPRLTVYYLLLPFPSHCQPGLGVKTRTDERD